MIITRIIIIVIVIIHNDDPQYSYIARVAEKVHRLPPNGVYHKTIRGGARCSKNPETSSLRKRLTTVRDNFEFEFKIKYLN